MQGYFTLEESAALLGMPADDLKQMARKGEIRSFQDRGTWRFRKQDIEEMSRRRGDGSDLEMATQKQLTPRPTDSPAPRSPKPEAQENEVFNFSLAPEDEGAGAGQAANDDEATINIAADIPPGKSASSSGGKKSGSGKRVPPGTDSDVRLVADGSDLGLKAPADSDVKVASDSGPKSSSRSSKTNVASPKSPKPAKSEGDRAASEQVDSGVRLVPIDSDSDVRIVGADSDDVPLGDRPPKGATDSDIRLEGTGPVARTGTSDPPLTEEINLDEELRKEEARRKEHKGHPKKSAEPEFPTKSPFELSTSDLNLKPIKAEKDESQEGSSDFDLTPAGESSSPLELGSDDFKLRDDVTLADDDAADLKGTQSGISLDHPADSGISLEQDSSAEAENEFELTLDAETTPKPAPSKAPASKQDAEADSDSSEFELSLDVDAAAPSDSDSEFELTLDDTSAMDVADVQEDAQEKDIFETDFEVPALDEESGSEAVAVDDSDTALESSEFELEIGEEDVAAMDDSGSEVVALDDEDAEAPAPKKGRKKAAVGEFAEFDEGEPELEIEEEAGEEIEEEEFATAAVAQQAPWGILPVAVLLPCVIVMMLVGMLGLEHVQAQQGYKPGVLTKAIGGLMGDKK